MFPRTSGKDMNLGAARLFVSVSIRGLLISIRIRDGRRSFSRRHPNNHFAIPVLGWWDMRVRKVVLRWQRERDAKRLKSMLRRFRVCRLWMCSISAVIGVMLSHDL